MSEHLPQVSRHHPLQPPSHRDPAYRKSQQLRSYVSLLQATPLMIFFQHNNLTATEWIPIRRELRSALARTDATMPDREALADSIKLQVIQTRMFEPALRIAEYYDPASPLPTPAETQNPATGASKRTPDLRKDPSLTHALSTRAYEAASANRAKHPLTQLLQGSIAILSFPSVTPQHLSTALSILAPQKPAFPPPTRRQAPLWHEPTVQDGLKKLLLLGARVEDRAMDHEGVRWIGGIEGGLDGLRAQLVMALQGAGVGLTGALEGLGKNLWMTMESRRVDMEEKAGGGEKKE
jgi:large subunit ribosomal protein L10